MNFFLAWYDGEAFVGEMPLEDDANTFGLKLGDSLPITKDHLPWLLSKGVAIRLHLLDFFIKVRK